MKNLENEEIAVYPEFLHMMDSKAVYRNGTLRSTGSWVDLQTKTVTERGEGAAREVGLAFTTFYFSKLTVSGRIVFRPSISCNILTGSYISILAYGGLWGSGAF